MPTYERNPEILFPTFEQVTTDPSINERFAAVTPGWQNGIGNSNALLFDVGVDIDLFVVGTVQVGLNFCYVIGWYGDTVLDFSISQVPAGELSDGNDFAKMSVGVVLDGTLYGVGCYAYSETPDQGGPFQFGGLVYDTSTETFTTNTRTESDLTRLDLVTNATAIGVNRDDLTTIWIAESGFIRIISLTSGALIDSIETPVDVAFGGFFFINNDIAYYQGTDDNFYAVENGTVELVTFNDQPFTFGSGLDASYMFFDGTYFYISEGGANVCNVLIRWEHGSNTYDVIETAESVYFGIGPNGLTGGEPE